MLRHIIIVFLVVFLGLTSSLKTFAQTAFFNFPSNGSYEIRVDHNEVYTTNKFELGLGNHTIEIWSPGIELINDTVLVRNDFLPRYDYSVLVDTNFLNMKKDLQYFKSKRFISKVFPVVLNIGLGVGAYFQYRKAKSQYNELVDLSSLYETSSSPNFLGDYKFLFVKKNKIYNRSRTFFYTLVGAAVATSAFTIFTYRMFNKNNVKPNLRKFYTSRFAGKEYTLDLGISLNSFLLICTI